MGLKRNRPGGGGPANEEGRSERIDPSRGENNKHRLQETADPLQIVDFIGKKA